MNVVLQLAFVLVQMMPFPRNPGASYNGYAYQATLALPGATTSTQTNISLPFSFSAAVMKTVANGGQIQNLCTENTYSVPCDFIITDQSNCGVSGTAYRWDFDGDYSASAGTGHGHVLVPSYTTGGVTPYVCVGNSSVSTWQGGSPPYDSFTKARYPFPNGSTLSFVDFSGNGNTGTGHNSPAACAGQVDGCAGFTAGSSQYVSLTETSGLPIISSAGYSVSFWIKGAACGSAMTIIGEAVASSSTQSIFEIYCRASHSSNISVAIDNSSGTNLLTQSSSATVMNSAWHNVYWTDSNGTAKIYIDGSLDATSFNYTYATVSPTNDTIGAINAGSLINYATASVDEVRYESTARSASWVATISSAETTIVAIGTFTAI